MCCRSSLSVLVPPTGQLAIQADGVVRVAPTTAAYAGKNANVAKLADGYVGLVVTTAQLTIPYAAPSKAITLKDGDACPAGTPYAGQKGNVIISYWTNFASKSPTTSIDPSAIRITANSLVTIAFLPDGKKPLQPSQATINKMLVASQAGNTTPTSAPATTVPVTVPINSSTTTTTPSTTTTAK